MDSCCDIVPTGSANVGPRDIFDRKPGGIAALTRVDARSDINWLVDIAELEVAECDIAHAALAWVSLDPSRVGGVVAFEVLEQDIVDVVWPVSIAKGADDCAPRLVASHVADINILAVAFDRNAVLGNNVRTVDEGKYRETLHRNTQPSSFE